MIDSTKVFRKVKFINAQADFKLVTYRSVVNPLTDGTELLDNDFGNETIYKIIPNFMIISINNMSQHEDVPYHLDLICTDFLVQLIVMYI